MMLMSVSILMFYGKGWIYFFIGFRDNMKKWDTQKESSWEIIENGDNSSISDDRGVRVG